MLEEIASVHLDKDNRKSRFSLCWFKDVSDAKVSEARILESAALYAKRDGRCENLHFNYIVNDPSLTYSTGKYRDIIVITIPSFEHVEGYDNVFVDGFEWPVVDVILTEIGE